MKVEPNLLTMLGLLFRRKDLSSCSCFVLSSVTVASSQAQPLGGADASFLSCFLLLRPSEQKAKQDAVGAGDRLSLARNHFYTQFDFVMLLHAFYGDEL